MVLVSADGGYGTAPATEKPEPAETENSSSTTIGVQGMIYCKSGSELIPLEGAVARITCLSVDKRGKERAPFSVLSDATDNNGYYLVTLSPSEIKHNWRLKECKAFLEMSPSETCNVPTDINNGTSGYLLAKHRLLKNKNIILFSVWPFFFQEDITTSNGY
ncbi:protein SEED AND ROOT HAIR PROTECTIVE PROTEIN-like [Mangifera indica]|uniref:protein SEED AND ROOT HAIR PROTECTIVE PROTEIN-like n=1 Tax=Mangifera indica TaxID=29780 RepID=UPI001CFA6F0E|nr:protein SEED AND ROOT HAIR PROTECTIVE PROTEIN-like [Mangifera indica]